jgi:hypothetical protein
MMHVGVYLQLIDVIIKEFTDVNSLDRSFCMYMHIMRAEPLVDELLLLQSGIKVYDADTEEDNVDCRAMLLFATADYRGLNALSNQMTAPCLNGACIHCEVKGSKSSAQDTTIYPGAVLFCKDNKIRETWHRKMGPLENELEVDGQKIQMIVMDEPLQKTKDKFNECGKNVEDAKCEYISKKKLEEIKRKNGVHGYHVFIRLKYFDPTIHFVNDPFHMFANFIKEVHTHVAEKASDIKWKNRSAFYNQPNARFYHQLQHVCNIYVLRIIYLFCESYNGFVELFICLFICLIIYLYY